MVSIRKVRYENKVVLGLSYSEDVDPYQVQVGIPHDKLEVSDIKSATIVQSVRVGDPAVGVAPNFYYMIEGTCNLNIQYTEDL